MANHSAKVPDYLNEDYVQKFLRDSLEDPTLVVNKCDISPGSAAGDNYACQILRLNLQLTRNGKNTELSIIAKVKAITKAIEVIKDVDTNFDIYRIEAKFLTDVVPKMHENLKSLKIDKKLGPKTYFCDNENSLFFMEDLKARGFTLKPRIKFLDLNECLLVADSLGAFHASTFKLLKDDPKLYSNYETYFWKKDLGPLKKMTDNAFKALENDINAWDLPEHLTKKILGLKEAFEHDAFALAEPEEGDPLKVLSHGDCWKNNMMFRYENGNVQEVCFLDFQCVNYNSFANDLNYFLFTSADADVITDHLDEFLTKYYNSFDSVMPGVLDIETVKNRFGKKLYLGMMWFLLFRPMMITEVPPDIDDMIVGNYTVNTKSVHFVAQVKKLAPYFEQSGIL